MDTKCKAKINKLGEMISALLMKVVENKELYGDVYKLREKAASCKLQASSFKLDNGSGIM